MYVLALSDDKQHAAAAGYKPAPQLGRQIAAYKKAPQVIAGLFYYVLKDDMRLETFESFT